MEERKEKKERSQKGGDDKYSEKGKMGEQGITKERKVVFLMERRGKKGEEMGRKIRAKSIKVRKGDGRSKEAIKEAKRK